VRRESLEIDVVVAAPPVPGWPRRVLSLGEAKLGRVMGARDLQRLRRAAGLLTARGDDTADAVLACYGGAGFEPGLDQALLVGPDALYAAPADDDDDLGGP
jgi:uncharacterized protein